MSISIVGGGIGGLTAAIALHQKGIEATVFEQSVAIQPVGAGILLGNNVMQIYDRLQLRNRLEAVANPIHNLQITRADFRPLSKVSLAPFVKRYRVNNLAIHRADLQQTLLEAIPEERVLLAKQLVSLDTGSKLQLRFKDGSHYESDAVIGADGIYSKVRQIVFPDGQIRSANQVCWRGVAELSMPNQDLHLVREAWGHGIRFGVVPLDTKRVYWFAVQSSVPGPVAANKAELEELFSGFHPLVKDLISATSEKAIHRANLEDLQLKGSWSKGNITLLGDAAHAMTPNMGQGAGQAIEDAYLLGTALSEIKKPSAAFAAYYQARRKKVKKLVAASWQIGGMAHWQSKVPVAFRSVMMKSMPAWIGRQQLTGVFKLDTL